MSHFTQLLRTAHIDKARRRRNKASVSIHRLKVKIIAKKPSRPNFIDYNFDSTISHDHLFQISIMFPDTTPTKVDDGRKSVILNLIYSEIFQGVSFHEVSHFVI